MSNTVAIVFALCIAHCVGSLSAADECVACDSTKERNCAVNPGILVPQKCTVPSNGTPQCYSRVVGGVTFRGCFNELDEAVRNSCIADNLGYNCTVCENTNGVSGCNNWIFPANRLRCHSCAENGLMGSCFTGFEANATPCKVFNPDDRCYIRKTEKTIERGCLSETSKCENLSHCFICDGEGCNNLEGNNTAIPTTSSASVWAPTIGAVLITILVSFALTSRMD